MAYQWRHWTQIMPNDVLAPPTATPQFETFNFSFQVIDDKSKIIYILEIMYLLVFNVFKLVVYTRKM